MSYIGQIPLPQATEERIERTATAGQTLFTGLTYVNGHISVYVNGVKLDNADFTATDGTTVTLGTGAAAGDTVSFVSTTQTSALMSLPLKDSAGNNVLSESGGTVTLGNASVDETFSGMMEVDQWYLTANKGNADPVIDWSRNNFNSFAKIGTGLSETSSNSGIFKFPRNGVYEITFHAMFRHSNTDDHTVEIDLQINPDNSSFSSVARITEGLVASTHNGSASNTFLANVTNNSVFQFKFITNSLSGSNTLQGQTSTMQTNFVIKRLGPAQ